MSSSQHYSSHVASVCSYPFSTALVVLYSVYVVLVTPLCPPLSITLLTKLLYVVSFPRLLLFFAVSMSSSRHYSSHVASVCRFHYHGSCCSLQCLCRISHTSMSSSLHYSSHVASVCRFPSHGSCCSLQCLCRISHTSMSSFLHYSSHVASVCSYPFPRLLLFFTVSMSY